MYTLICVFAYHQKILFLSFYFIYNFIFIILFYFIYNFIFIFIILFHFYFIYNFIFIILFHFYFIYNFILFPRKPNNSIVFLMHEIQLTDLSMREFFVHLIFRCEIK